MAKKQPQPTKDDTALEKIIDEQAAYCSSPEGIAELEETARVENEHLGIGFPAPSYRKAKFADCDDDMSDDIPF